MMIPDRHVSAVPPQRLETERVASRPNLSDSGAERVPSLPLLDHVRQQPDEARALDGAASSRCFLADTAVMRLGTILPRSDT